MQGQTHLETLVDLKLQNPGASQGTLLSGQAAHVTHRPVNSYREESPLRPAPHEMMAQREKCPVRSATTPTCPCFSDFYRCLRRRLGCSLWRSHSKRVLVPAGKQVAFQLPGTKGCLFGHDRVPRPLFKQDCTHNNRQHHSYCLHKQGRRHEIGPTVPYSGES